MDIKLNTLLAQGYKSNSQIARVLTEGWVNQNSYCPSCVFIPVKSATCSR